MQRGSTSGKARDSQIKSPPEKMYRAHFAGEPRTKFRKYPAGLRQNAPESLRIFRIISHMFLILLEWDWIRHFNWHGPDSYRYPKGSQGGHRFLIKLSYRARSQSN